MGSTVETPSIPLLHHFNTHSLYTMQWHERKFTMRTRSCEKFSANESLQSLGWLV